LAAEIDLRRQHGLPESGRVEEGESLMERRSCRDCG
jgi:hypothetical protein